jgi:oligosaccharide repeat unit polymerase
MPAPLNIFPAIWTTVLVAIALVVDLQHDIRRLVSGRSVVLLGIGSWFLLEALTLSPSVRAYSQDQYNAGVCYVALAVAGFLAGYHLFRGCPAFVPMAAQVRVLDDPRLLWRVVLFCGVVGFAPIVFYSGLQLVALLHGILGMRQTWGGLIARGRYGGFREALLQLENLVTGIGPFAAILLLDRRGAIHRRLSSAIVALWPMLRAYGSGTRSALLMSGLPLLAVLYFHCKPPVQRRLLLLGLCATPLVYWFMATIVVSRDTGTLDWEKGAKVDYVGNEMFQELLYITSNVPGRVPYQMGATYFVQLCAPIPRFIWPAKPSLEVGIMMAQLRGEVDKTTGEAFYTRSPGLLGEMYLNFGLPGLFLLSVLGGWLVRGWDRIAESYASSLPTMIFYVAGLAAFYFLGRSFTVQLFYPLVFFSAAVSLLTYHAAATTSAALQSVGPVRTCAEKGIP